MIDQMAQGMFKGAGEDLLVKVNGQEFQAFVGGFETCHGEILPASELEWRNYSMKSGGYHK